MARPKRSRRTPFVLTVAAAAVATPLACGGTAVVSGDGTNQGGTAGSGTGGTRASGGSTSADSGFEFGGVGANPPGFGGTSFGGVGGVGGYPEGGVGGGYAVGGVGGTGGVATVCPPTRPTGLGVVYACALPPDVTCTYVEHCQSGDVEFSYGCTNGYLSLTQTGCSLPYDSCAGTSLWCGPAGWTDFSTGTNPPSPCPAQRPADGTSCSVFNFGANISPCGYHCDGSACGGCPSGTWLTTSCVATDAGTGYWQGAYCGPTPAP